MPPATAQQGLQGQSRNFQQGKSPDSRRNGPAAPPTAPRQPAEADTPSAEGGVLRPAPFSPAASAGTHRHHAQLPALRQQLR